MTIKHLFSITAILELIFGLAWILLPETMLAGWGILEASEISIYMSRRYAILFFGYAVILWMVRSASASRVRYSLVVGNFVGFVLMAVMSLIGVLTNTINASGYMAVVIEVLLAIGFGYFLFVKREPTV